MEKKGIDPGVLNPARKLVARLQENKKSLHIARVPDKTKERFKALAEAEFCGDYGMLLKSLMDGIPSQDIIEILYRIEQLEERINNLEMKENKPQMVEKKPTIKMLNGQERVIRGLNKDE